MSEDDYMPMIVDSPEQYEAVIDACWFTEDLRITGQGQVHQTLSLLLYVTYDKKIIITCIYIYYALTFGFQ